jgi:predicted PurR-regulated permease PerM
VWLLAPGVADQIDELRKSLPQSVRQLGQRIERYEWGRQVLAQKPNADELMPDRADVLARATGVFSTTLGAFANFFIIIFIGLYLAAEPRLYTGGIIRLVPASRRERAREILRKVGSTLRWWLIGKVASMIVIGALTAGGLWLLGVPLALTLGLLAALLTFIPNLGPILAVVPAALLALLQSLTRALYVILLYLGIQAVESYFLTPLMQKRTVSLPPALTIFAQVLLGVLVGGLGLALATPFTAAVFVLVRMLYVEDTLRDSIETVNDEREVS